MTTATVRSASNWSEVRSWPLLCDAEWLLPAARARGWSCVRSLDGAIAAAERPARCLLIATRPDTLRDPRLPAFLATTRSLYLGLHAFDASAPAAAYSLEMLGISDFGGA